MSNSPDALPSFAEALSPNCTLQQGMLRICRVLGQGGFGITYQAEDMWLRRDVAIKEFFPNGCQREGFKLLPASALCQADFTALRAQFFSEGQTLARFNHPSIVRVLSIFEENASVYLVMEFLRGQNLEEVLENAGPVPWPVALKYVTPVAEALSIVHKAHVLHRDVKPGNIIICDDGRVVLLDFGLAREIINSAAYTTRPLSANDAGIQYGSEGYAPIEQYGRNTVSSPATDMYALGATLYHLLTGKCPLTASARAAGDILQPPHSLNPAVPRNLSALALQCMEMQPSLRPQAIEDFLNQLNQVRSDSTEEGNSESHWIDSFSALSSHDDTAQPLTDRTGSNGGSSLPDWVDLHLKADEETSQPPWWKNTRTDE